MLKLVYEVPVNSPDAFRPLSVFRLPARVSHRKLSFQKTKKKEISSRPYSRRSTELNSRLSRDEMRKEKKRRRRRKKAIFLTFQSIARPISIHLQLKACSPLSSVVINISIHQAFNRGSRPVRGTARRGG